MPEKPFWGRDLTMTAAERQEKDLHECEAYKYPAWCQTEEALHSYEQDRKVYLEAEAKTLGPWRAAGRRHMM